MCAGSGSRFAIPQQHIKNLYSIGPGAAVLFFSALPKKRHVTARGQSIFTSPNMSINLHGIKDMVRDRLGISAGTGRKQNIIHIMNLCQTGQT